MNPNKLYNIKFDGVDHSDFPKYTDAYISEAMYEGEYLTEDELDQINENTAFVYSRVTDYIIDLRCAAIEQER